jgi:hypothetical protein
MVNFGLRTHIALLNLHKIRNSQKLVKTHVIKF